MYSSKEAEQYTQGQSCSLVRRTTMGIWVKDIPLVSMTVWSGRSKFGPTDHQNRPKQG